MGVLVIVEPKLTIATQNLTTWVREIAMDLEADQVDSTTAGSSGWRTSLPGLKKGQVKLTFAQDYAAAALDSLLWTWFGTNQAFTAKATQAVNSATNPEYQGTLVCSQHSPLVGKIGDLAEVSVTFDTSGAIVRAVA